MPGTRNGPREILVASSHMELWDEETGTDVHRIGIYTLPEMELPFDDMADVMAEIRRVASAILEHDKFPVVLGGEHSITAPVVAAVAAKHPGLSVLQIDAHADLRDSYMGTPLQPRLRDAPRARARAVHAGRHPEPVDGRGGGSAGAADQDLLRLQHAAGQRTGSTRVVESLGDKVYITIDVDGLDPAIMPAVGTPEPGGLAWHELLALLRAVISARTVVGCDIVELWPLPGVAAPNFLCAKLVYKILTYQFAVGDKTQESGIYSRRF